MQRFLGLLATGLFCCGATILGMGLSARFFAKGDSTSTSEAPRLLQVQAADLEEPLEAEAPGLIHEAPQSVRIASSSLTQLQPPVASAIVGFEDPLPPPIVGVLKILDGDTNVPPKGTDGSNVRVEVTVTSQKGPNKVTLRINAPKGLTKSPTPESLNPTVSPVSPALDPSKDSTTVFTITGLRAAVTEYELIATVEKDGKSSTEVKRSFKLMSNSDIKPGPVRITQEISGATYRGDSSDKSAAVREMWLLDRSATVKISFDGAVSGRSYLIACAKSPGNLDKPNLREIRSDVDSAAQETRTCTVNPALQDKENWLGILDVWEGKIKEPRIAVHVPPESQQTVARPVVLAAADGTYADFRPLTTSSSSLPVFGSYLRLRGQNFPENGGLRFLVYEQLESPARTFEIVGLAKAQVTRESKGDWIATLTLPESLKAKVKARLFVIADDRNGLHNVSDPLDLEIQESPVPPPPSLGKIKPAGGSAIDRDTQAKAYLVNEGDFVVTAKDSAGIPPHAQLLLFDVTGPEKELARLTNPDNNPTAKAWEIAASGLKTGRAKLQLAFARGADTLVRSELIDVIINTSGPTVAQIVPPNFGTAPGVQTLQVQFNPENPIDSETAKVAGNYTLRASNGTGNFDRGIETNPTTQTPNFNSATNTVELTFNNLRPDIYRLEINGRKDTGGIRDIYGNYLKGDGKTRGTDYLKVMDKPADKNAAGTTTGPFVEFREYEPRPALPDGFNPADHVETRVARLYYERNAHRVAQIINRNVKAYNKGGVEAKRLVADQAREKANTATDERREAEQKAVEAAQAARAAEQQLQAQQAALSQARTKSTQAGQNTGFLQQQLTAAQNLQPDPATEVKTEADKQARIDKVNAQLQTAQNIQLATEADVTDLTKRVSDLQSTVQAKRAEELQKTETSRTKTATEDRAREDQFRLEVAAAQEDPDSYAPGKTDSKDPVAQVSISVIGEGVIQLRGPIKGINLIRMMINEIDQPVGQVRISVHTAQVNGEHGDRMEKVVHRIQRYIDHSRFLTSQSAEMLRRAVVDVATRRAEETGLIGVENSQQARDEKYLYAFFGREFIDELKALDSEFLRSGNKLLSLHSMDTTSLSNALFLMGLAKNSTRQEILATFQQLIQCELPQMECDYFLASGGKKAYGCGKFEMFSSNARFSSLQGYFQTRAALDDTMTPVQREFIRLAQIFKSRLVTELELNQRVMERGLIEQRGINSEEERALAIAKDRSSREAVEMANKTRIEGFQTLQSAVSQLLAIADQLAVGDQMGADAEAQPELRDSFLRFRDERRKRIGGSDSTEPIKADVHDTKNQFYVTLNDQKFRFWVVPAEKGSGKIVFTDPKSGVRENPAIVDRWKQAFNTVARRHIKRQQLFDAVSFQLPKHAATARRESLFNARLSNNIETNDDAALELNNLWNLTAGAENQKFLGDALRSVIEEFSDRIRQIIADLRKPNSDAAAAFARWKIIKKQISAYIGDPDEFAALVDSIRQIDLAFEKLMAAEDNLATTRESAKNANLPLDHKKFLDMLIDETQDKYIELLEGTRAHTANIDNYIKRLTTALDDDFNTQFYRPAFREVRNASRMHDVNLGQIETTSILTNNRNFAKVSPQATMEFDLPKRDILINEAFKSSKALFDDYGALMQDPSFLALTKLNSGSPTSSPALGSGGTSPVRDVLPGLPSQTNEKLMGQAGPGNRQFGSALEALIPDPAIYKFETGTGYEIRPVIQPDGQAVVFHFNYMYTTNVREPVRADEKHLGRVKRHFIDTDVQLSNFELREVSRYQVALKASRTARGVPLLEDVPGLGILFRPLPQAESSLQENVIMAQSTIFPTLFDLMGLRWAPAVADLDPLRLWNDDFIVRSRKKDLSNRVYDLSSSRVDEFMRTPQGERRTDLYRSQETIPSVHPDGYRGPGLNMRDSQMQEGYNPSEVYPESRFAPGTNNEGANPQPGPSVSPPSFLEEIPPSDPQSGARRKARRVRPDAPAVVKMRDGVAPEKARVAAKEPRRLNQETQTAGARPIPAGSQPPRGYVTPARFDLPEQKPQAKGWKIFSPFRKGKGE